MSKLLKFLLKIHDKMDLPKFYKCLSFEEIRNTESRWDRPKGKTLISERSIFGVRKQYYVYDIDGTRNWAYADGRFTPIGIDTTIRNFEYELSQKERILERAKEISELCWLFLHS